MSPFWNCKYPKYFALQLLCFFEVWTQRQNCRQTEAQTGGQKRLECSSWWWEAEAKATKIQISQIFGTSTLAVLGWTQMQRERPWQKLWCNSSCSREATRGQRPTKPPLLRSLTSSAALHCNALGIPSGIFRGHTNERLDRWMLVLTKCSFCPILSTNKMRGQRRFSLRCWDH